MASLNMSKDARKIIQAIQSHNGNQEPTITDVVMAESLAYSFYSKTVVSHISRAYNPNSKSDPNRVAFYVGMTKSLNKGRRNKDEWVLTDEEWDVYSLVGHQYLIEDYNYDALLLMRRVCGYPIEHVREAIKMSLEADVRSVPYLASILDGIEARLEHKRQQVEERRKMFVTDTGSEEIRRGPLEMANLMYGWQETIQNVELQNKVDRLLREGEK